MKYLLTCLLILTFAQTADAQLFGRRGCRDGNCNVSHIQRMDVRVNNRDIFIFNNGYPAASQGNTIYGYSVNSATAQDNAALFLNQSSRFLDNAQATSTKGFELFQETGREYLKQQTILAAMVASPPTTTVVEVTGNSVNEIPINEVQVTKLSVLVSTKCIKCHSGDKPKGGMDITLIDSFDAGKLEEIAKRITSRGEDKMPPDKALNWKEQSIFFNELNQRK